MLENPKIVFKNFFAISRIPRGSGNEKGVSDFVADFARKNGAEVTQDTRHNLIIKKAGDARPPIILQAHLDMVCEKNADTRHDFTRDPLDLYTDGDFLRARGTTLGADNGIGVAMCMALLEGDFSNQPLEILLTADEEAGMSGAQNIDISGLKATRMLNLDSSDDTTFTMGCAAGTTAEFAINAARSKTQDAARCEIRVTGLHGGHSGGDIHLERGNALRILAFLLDAAAQICEVQIGEISGGMKVNAIPREAAATIFFPQDEIKKIRHMLDEFSANFKMQFRVADPELKITHEFSAAQGAAFSTCDSRKISAALVLFPNGVIAKSREIEGLVNASCNVGVAESCDTGVKILAMPRGADAFYTRQTETQIVTLAKAVGADVNFLQRSPAWPYNPDSPLLADALEIYKNLFNKNAQTTAVHGGLECGIFSEKFAARGVNLDIISFGPNAHDYHTPSERLSISSTERVWEFLLEFLRAC